MEKELPLKQCLPNVYLVGIYVIMYKSMKAIIFAAGKGNRLKPLTDTTPKPLLLIENKPIIAHIIDELPDQITDVYIVGKHLIEQIHDFVHSFNTTKNITVVEQINSHSGTMAALLSVKGFFKDKNERFMVLNGDDLQIKSELDLYLEKPRAFGIQKMHIPYYVIESENGIVKNFRKQTEEEKISGAKIATGVYVLDAQIFEFEPVVLSDGDIGLPQTILAYKETYPVHVIETNEWIPVNTIEDLEVARLKMKNRVNM